MKRLPESIKEAINQGNFTVKKTGRVFFCHGDHDQAHKQNNRVVRADGGSIVIMETQAYCWNEH